MVQSGLMVTKTCSNKKFQFCKINLYLPSDSLICDYVNIPVISSIWTIQNCVLCSIRASSSLINYYHLNPKTDNLSFFVLYMNHKVKVIFIHNSRYFPLLSAILYVNKIITDISNRYRSPIRQIFSFTCQFCRNSLNQSHLTLALANVNKQTIRVVVFNYLFIACLITPLFGYY